MYFLHSNIMIHPIQNLAATSTQSQHSWSVMLPRFIWGQIVCCERIKKRSGSIDVHRVTSSIHNWWRLDCKSGPDIASRSRLLFIILLCVSNSTQTLCFNLHVFDIWQSICPKTNVSLANWIPVSLTITHKRTSWYWQRECFLVLFITIST